jgi:dethiobiotin synthetase
LRRRAVSAGRDLSEPVRRAVVAERAGVPVDWDAVQRSVDAMSRECDVLIVEGVGGILAPVDATHTALDLARWIDAPTVVVTRPGLGTINHTSLTVRVLKDVGVKVSGVVVNRYPPDRATVAEETNLRQIEKWAKTAVLAVVPEAKISRDLPADVVSAIGTVDWAGKMGLG